MLDVDYACPVCQSLSETFFQPLALVKYACGGGLSSQWKFPEGKALVDWMHCSLEVFPFAFRGQGAVLWALV